MLFGGGVDLRFERRLLSASLVNKCLLTNQIILNAHYRHPQGMNVSSELISTCPAIGKCACTVWSSRSEIVIQTTSELGEDLALNKGRVLSPSVQSSGLELSVSSLNLVLLASMALAISP